MNAKEASELTHESMRRMELVSQRQIEDNIDLINNAIKKACNDGKFNITVEGFASVMASNLKKHFKNEGFTVDKIYQNGGEAPYDYSPDLYKLVVSWKKVNKYS